MFLGENVIAQAWSFSNDMKDIPYLIKRLGKPKAMGGTGYKWNCTCPSSMYRKSTCKHILGLRESVKNGIAVADGRFIISDLGLEIFKI